MVRGWNLLIRAFCLRKRRLKRTSFFLFFIFYFQEKPSTQPAIRDEYHFNELFNCLLQCKCNNWGWWGGKKEKTMLTFVRYQTSKSCFCWNIFPSSSFLWDVAVEGQKGLSQPGQDSAVVQVETQKITLGLHETPGGISPPFLNQTEALPWSQTTPWPPCTSARLYKWN